MTEDDLSTVDGRHVLHMRRHLPHPADKVWRAITDPAHLQHWFPAEVRRDGAKIYYSFGGEDGGYGEVTDLDEPRLFAYTWDGSLLRWEIIPEDGGCLLLFTHTFDDRPGAASFAAGWHACIQALRALLDGAAPPSAGPMVPEHEAYVRRFRLDHGTVQRTAHGWRVHFSRQLTAPAAQVWRHAMQGAHPRPGTPAPHRLAGPGTVVEVDPPHLLVLDTPHGPLRWELGEGTGHGARLNVTCTGATGDPAAVEGDLRQHIEHLAARIASG